MEKEFEFIIKAIKNIKLKEDEKFEMRQNIVNPKIKSPYYFFQSIKSFYFMTNKYKFVPTFALVLLVVLAGGVSAFAEKAIPGDLLYGVKVSVNEPIAGIFALSKEEKTEWKERLVERRLDEAQKLVSKNNLSENTRTYLENKIKNQIDQFSTNANELALQKNESANSSDLNIRLQASLKAYQNVLTTLSGDNNIGADTKQETGKLLVTLEESQNKVKDDHQSLESKNNGGDSASALAKQTVALNLLNSTKLLYQNEKANLSANIQSQVDNKFAEAETALQEGKTLVDSADYLNATDKFQSVIDSINETRLLMLSNVIKGKIENDDSHLKSDKPEFNDIELEEQD